MTFVLLQTKQVQILLRSCSFSHATPSNKHYTLSNTCGLAFWVNMQEVTHVMVAAMPEYWLG